MRALAVALLMLLVGCTPAAGPSATPPRTETASQTQSPPASAAATLPGPSVSATPGAALGEIVEHRSSAARNPADAATPDLLAAMVAGDQAFAFDLYRSLIGSEPGNVFFSPYSISTALSMLLAGARGSTAEELADALHAEHDAAWHLARNRLELELAALADYEMTGSPDAVPLTLEPTNAFFGRTGYPFHEEYLDELAANYGAGIHALDFVNRTEPSREAINNWVAERTRDRIPELLPIGFVTPETVAVLVNAIFFKANWLYQFDAGNTDNEPFRMLDGSTVDVPLMERQEKWQYVEGDGWQAVELPYVGGASMLMIVPMEGRFADVEAVVDESFVAEVRAGLTEHLVSLEMPRWESEFNVDLIPHLKSLGVERIFGDADLTGIADAELSVSGVVHNANVTVDEMGTEAAAATAVAIGESGAPPAVLTVDRPFIYLIYDDDNGEILFFGRLLRP